MAQPLVSFRCGPMQLQGLQRLTNSNPVLPSRASRHGSAAFPLRSNNHTQASNRLSVALQNRAVAEAVDYTAVSEAEDLKNAFVAIQKEVAAYKELSIELSKVQDLLIGVTKERDQALRQRDQAVRERDQARVQIQHVMMEKESALQQQASRAQFSIAQEKQTAMAQMAAAQQDKELALSRQEQQFNVRMLKAQQEALAERNAAQAEKVQALEEQALQFKPLADENLQLLNTLASSAQRLVETVYPASSLPNNVAIRTELTAGSEVVQAKAAVKPAMSQATSPGAGQKFINWSLSILGGLLYFVASGLVLYFAAALLTGVPPNVTVEFALGCAVVSWLVPTIFKQLQPSPTASAA